MAKTQRYRLEPTADGDYLLYRFEGEASGDYPEQWDLMDRAATVEIGMQKAKEIEERRRAIEHAKTLPPVEFEV